MRRYAVVLVAAAALTIVGCSGSVTPTEPVQDPSKGARAVAELYPDAKGGDAWYAAWQTGQNPLDDPWLTRGSNDIAYRVEGDVLSITGQTHRLYVRDPELEKQWEDVEVTVYAMRVADDDIPYSGIVSAVRTDHGTTGSLDANPCDSRGLSARLRNDGDVDFGKETVHPTTIATKPVGLFPGGLPKGKWIGYKHVVYDIEDGTGTRQELWIDMTGGADGGEWQLVASHDDLPYSDFGQVACAPGVDPTIPYVNGPREGSESGKPSIAVYFRADGMWKDGLQYKWASVREINPN